MPLLPAMPLDDAIAPLPCRHCYAIIDYCRHLPLITVAAEKPRASDASADFASADVMPLFHATCRCHALLITGHYAAILPRHIRFRHFALLRHFHCLLMPIRRHAMPFSLLFSTLRHYAADFCFAMRFSRYCHYAFAITRWLFSPYAFALPFSLRHYADLHFDAR